jgi:hypothetical protein
MARDHIPQCTRFHLDQISSPIWVTSKQKEWDRCWLIPFSFLFDFFSFFFPGKTAIFSLHRNSDDRYTRVVIDDTYTFTYMNIIQCMHHISSPALLTQTFCSFCTSKRIVSTSHQLSTCTEMTFVSFHFTNITVQNYHSNSHNTMQAHTTASHNDSSSTYHHEQINSPNSTSDTDIFRHIDTLTEDASGAFHLFYATSGKWQIAYGSYSSENCLNHVWYLIFVLECSNCLTCVFHKTLV